MSSLKPSPPAEAEPSLPPASVRAKESAAGKKPEPSRSERSPDAGIAESNPAPPPPTQLQFDGDREDFLGFGAHAQTPSRKPQPSAPRERNGSGKDSEPGVTWRFAREPGEDEGRKRATPSSAKLEPMSEVQDRRSGRMAQVEEQAEGGEQDRPRLRSLNQRLAEERAGTGVATRGAIAGPGSDGSERKLAEPRALGDSLKKTTEKRPNAAKERSRIRSSTSGRQRDTAPPSPQGTESADAEADEGHRRIRHCLCLQLRSTWGRLSNAAPLALTRRRPRGTGAPGPWRRGGARRPSTAR